MSFFNKVFGRKSDTEVETDSRSVPKLPFGERAKNYFKSRKFKHGGLATILIVFFIIAMIILNIVAALLVGRVPALSPDLSQGQIYSLGEQTLQILDAIPEEYEIEIEIFATEIQCETPPYEIDPYGTIPQAYDMIKRYQQSSDKVTIVNTDLVRSAYAVSKYSEEVRSQIQDYYIAVSSYKQDGNIAHTKLTSFYEMLPHLVDESYYQSTDEMVLSSLVETIMSSQIKTVCQTNIPKAVVLAGNDNRSSSNVKMSLNTNGFDIAYDDVNLMTDQIPQDADVAVLVAPMRDLTIEEVNKLDAYLSNDGKMGKNLVFFANASMPQTPTLDSFLMDWDIEVTRNTVFETDASWISTEASYIFLNAVYKEERFAKGLGDRKSYVIMDRPLEIKLLDGTNASSILTTSTGGVSFSNMETPDLNSVSDGDKSERITAAYSERTSFEENKSGVFVFGTDSIFYSQYFISNAYANQTFLLNVFNELAGITDQQVYIQPKSLLTRDFDPSRSAVSAVTAVFMYIIPIVLIILGAYVFLRRRFL